MNRIEKRKNKVLWSGIILPIVLLIVLLIVLFSVPEVRAEVYTIQLGAFQKYANAQREFSRLKKSVPSNLGDYLRVEKTGKDYILQAGRFEDPEKALTVLKALKDYSPDAFIRKEEKVQNRPAGRRPQVEKIPSAKKSKNEPAAGRDPSLPVPKALFYGTIKDISSFNPEQLGLPPGKDIYRLAIRVDETKEIEGLPDLLKDQKDQLLTLFSETKPPFFQPGRRISAVVEYRGNRFSRYYWITKPQAL